MSEPLTRRQSRAIPAILAAKTIEDGCRAARVNRTTYYRWCHQPGFKAELARQRAELVAQGFAVLGQSVARAVETLVGLLDTGDDRLKRLTAKDVILIYLRHQELDELTRRVEAIENTLHRTGDGDLDDLSDAELQRRLDGLRQESLESFTAEQLEARLRAMRRLAGRGVT